MTQRGIRYTGAVLAGMATLGLLAGGGALLLEARWGIEPATARWIGGALACALGLLVVSGGPEIGGSPRDLAAGAALGVGGFLLAMGLASLLSSGPAGPVSTMDAVVAEQAFEGDWELENVSLALEEAGFGVVPTGQGGLAGETPAEDIWIRWLATPNGTQAAPNASALLTVGYRVQPPEPVDQPSASNQTLLEGHLDELEPRFEALLATLQSELGLQRAGQPSWAPLVRGP